MYRGVLDTNVLIAALLGGQGVPTQLYGRWRSGDFALVTSDYILGEFRKIAVQKLHTTSIELFPVLASLYDLAEIVEPIRISCTGVDGQDLPVLGTAVGGSADVLVTGDKKLLHVEQFQDIPIITPRAFLDWL